MFLRAYEDGDLQGLLEVWDRALSRDLITREDFERQVILDANREPESLMVAFETEAGAPIGFALSLVLLQPIERTGLLEHRGFITAFAVDPAHCGKGVGSALLDRAENFFRERGRKEIVISPYTPNYFVPGVDKAAYATGVEFLKKRGFSEFTEAIAMDARVDAFEIDAKTLEKDSRLRAEGIEVDYFKREWMAEYLNFMGTNMHGPWLEDARKMLREIVKGAAPEDSITVARQKGAIVGFCQFVGEHFGPFGVIDALQGKGIGSVLLAKTMLAMRRHGYHNAFLLWTGERAAQGVYGRLGFTVTRRFALMKKDLAP